MISFVIKNMSSSLKLITWSFYTRRFKIIRSFMVSWLRIDVFLHVFFVGKIFIKISRQICMRCDSYRMRSYLFVCYITFFLYISKKVRSSCYFLSIRFLDLLRPSDGQMSPPSCYTLSYESTISIKISCPLSDCYDNFIPTSELKH